MTYKHHVIPLHEWKQRINSKANRKNKEYSATDNIVWLTLEQHIQVHQLLYELNGSEFDRLATQVMLGKIDKESAHREAANIVNTGNKYSVGCIRSKEQKQQHSLFMKGSKYFEGRTHSEITKQKISIARKNTPQIWSTERKQLAATRARGYKNNLGRVWGEEYKKKMSLLSKGRPQKKITCPHCLMVGGNTMKTYHFNNCKYKVEVT